MSIGLRRLSAHRNLLSLPMLCCCVGFSIYLLDDDEYDNADVDDVGSLVVVAVPDEI